MKKIYLTLIVGMAIAFSSCSKLEVSPVDTVATEEETTMENLVVDAQFNWKTYNDLSLTLTGNTDNEIVEIRSSDGTVYQKAYLQNGESFDMKVAVPTYETSVNLAYNNQVVSVDISAGDIEYTFN